MRLRTNFATGEMRHRSRRVGSCVLPFVGETAIHVEDGRALLFPANGRGCIVRDWFSFNEYLRRHQQAATVCDGCGDILYDPIRGDLKGLCSSCCRGLGGGAYSARIVKAEAAIMRKR